MKKYFNLQLFTNEVKAADLEPAISVDMTSRLAGSIKALTDVLGIATLEPMQAGSAIKIYAYGTSGLAEQVEEGQEIALSHVARPLIATKELVLKKYRKQTTAEAIQKTGKAIAINGTDNAMISAIRADIKQGFYTNLEAGTGVASGATFQAALANTWAKVQDFFEDFDATPVFFVSATDVANYLGSANITTQNVFGFTYVENFMGLGTAIIAPKLTAGKIIGTAKENLHCAYIPATGGDLADMFGLTADESGLVGMTHIAQGSNASIDTLLLSGVELYPEYANGVIVGTITGA